MRRTARGNRGRYDATYRGNRDWFDARRPLIRAVVGGPAPDSGAGPM